MSAKADAWMPLYVSDWDDKTRHLDCEQDGAYGRLVRHYWKNGAPLDDDAQLARIVGMDRARWRKIRPTIAPFFKISGGRWLHERVEEELERARQIVEKRRQAGALGGRPRKQMVSSGESKPKANGYANGFANGKQNETPARVALPPPTPSSDEDSPNQEEELSQDRAVGSVVPFGGRP